MISLVAACTPTAVTPGARTFVVDTPTTLDRGQHDVQIDVNKIGTIWGPDLTAADGRLRTAVSDNVILEGETGILHLGNEGSGGERNAYTGRLGAIIRSNDQHAALIVGAGGGTSQAAGNWGSVDAGVVVAGKHEWARPVLSVDIGYSAPFDSERTFTVYETDGSGTELRLPRNVIWKTSFGLELGHPDACLVLGVSMIKFFKSESSRVASLDEDSTETFSSAGIGVRFKLD